MAGEFVPGVERLADAVQDQGRVAQRGQWHPANAVEVVVGDRCGGRERESGLTAAAGAKERARTLFEESKALAHMRDDRWGVAVTGSNLGYLALAVDDVDDAEHHLEDSLALLRELGANEETALPLQNLGYVALRREELVRARELFQQSRELSERVGSQEGVSYALEGLAAVLVEEGRAEEAAQALGAAQRIRRDTGATLEPFERALNQRTIAAARVALGDGDYDAARERGFAAAETT